MYRTNGTRKCSHARNGARAETRNGERRCTESTGNEQFGGTVGEGGVGVGGSSMEEQVKEVIRESGKLSEDFGATKSEH